MLANLPAEQITAAIDHVADAALWEAGVHEPPVDAFQVARQLGAVVAKGASDGPRARRVVLDHPADREAGVILLAPEDRPERRHWAVAHEVGEALAYRVFGDLGVDPVESQRAEREWVANRLAGALLLPRAWLIDAMVDFDADLYAIKDVFSTASHELIARRWLETIGGPILVTVFDHAQITWRRTNFGGGSRPALTHEERQTWRAAHDQGHATSCEPVVYADSNSLSRVRCWPVHEPGWKRDILLAEVADW